MAKAEKKHAWMKFYPQDWRGDTKLRSCSIGARGLWVEMLCIMHEADPYGHLMLGNAPVTNRQLAALAGITQKEALTFMAELGSAGVFTRSPEGVLFSRRMVRDHERAVKGKQDAEKRWRNGSVGGSPSDTPKADPNGVPTKTPITPESRKPDIDDGKTPARGASMITQQAYEVTDALEKAFGFQLPEEVPPGWFGCAMWVQRCLDDGWEPQVMIGAGKVIAKRARSAVMSFHYLEKPMAEFIAEHRRPLPKIEERQQETVHVTANRQGGDRSAHAAIARLRARIDGERVDDREANPDAIRLISPS